MSIRFGYACLTYGVPETEMRSCTLRTVSDEKLRGIITHNLRALELQIEYNAKQGIHLFRISSDLIPFGSSPVNTICWQDEFAQEFLRIGEKISNAGMRVSMHPGQYTVLNSPDTDVVERAVADLAYHEQVLSLLGTDNSSKIILHIGGVYGDRKAAVRRFVENWSFLGENIRGRVVLENDERSYHIAEVLSLANQLGVPAVFDVLHHGIHPPQQAESLIFWIRQCAQSWKPADGRQKIHYSQQEPDGRPGAHSQTIRSKEFLEFFTIIKGLDLDVMLEVKDKNISAVKCTLLSENPCSVQMLEEEWAHYKYAVLEHSQKNYLAVRELLKHKNGNNARPFYSLLEHALILAVQPGDAVNAAMHIWGYFKAIAEESEKKKFISLLENYQKGETSTRPIKNLLYRLSKRYGQQYILESYYFLYE